MQSACAHAAMHVLQCTGVPMCVSVLVAVCSAVYLDMCSYGLKLVCDIDME
jgi:Na+/H+ antiporter NhaC